jgi:uncharacterized protein YdhG (YjbR/CyaY superfamily)
MAETRPAKKGTQRSGKTTTRTTTASKAAKFTAEERAAMKERAKELKAGSKGDGESDVLAKIAEMTDADRAIAERVHAIVTQTSPDLQPRTWYGMPAYAKDGNVVCHFKPAQKFKTRYATLGFSDKASLDEGAMWPVEFAVDKLTAGVEKQIAALVKQATA